MNGIFDIINIPFGSVMRFFNNITGNYAIALLLFALVVKIIFIPLSIKQQKNQIRNAHLRPKMMAIEKKYAGRNDKATLNKKQQEIMELQQQEGASPLSGCLPMIIQLIVIMALYNIIRNPLTYICNFSADTVKALAEAAGFEAAKSIDQITLISKMKEIGLATFSAIEGFDASLIPNFEMFRGVDLSAIPDISSITKFSSATWLLLIPVLVFASQFFSMKITRKMNPAMQTASAPNVDMSNKIMDITMPLMTLFFAFNMSAAIGLYWIYQSIIGIVQSVILAKAMPLPVYTEEDLRRAEKEMKIKPQKNADRPKVRSLHHIDDDDDEIPAAPVKKQTEAKKPAMIEKAALKDDKAEEKTEATEEIKTEE
ncbi:MAG: YidC/Oxa1 family membrane protein insertase [Clostridia bacterium]|nr:YidC/Oxa1 family membrane protein insertase [Clostridia bacterium]